MYKKAQYRSQFWTHFHGWCGSTHEWTLLFLEIIGPIEAKMWEKMCPQIQFFGSKSEGIEFFEKRNLKMVFGTPSLPPQKRL